MARYFTSFDGNRPEGGVFPDFGFDLLPLHEQLLMEGTLEERTNLRAGLLASRSALSDEVYTELDSINQDGGKGIYFPPDTFITASSLYTASAYTSSVPGIVIPPPNFGAFSKLDFEVRPTASIFSDSSLVTPTVPLDSASFSSTLYLSASDAVSRVLNLNYPVIGQGGMYALPGNFPDRTFHSAWHDPDVTFFAWDNFTPGPPNLQVISSPLTFFEPITINCSQTTAEEDSPPSQQIITFIAYRVYYGRTFLNDFNPAGRIRFQLSWSREIDGPIEATVDTGLFIVTGSGASGANYYYETGSTNTQIVYPPQQPVELFPSYHVRATASFFDATIPESQGPFTFEGPSFFNHQCGDQQ
jgi:hypothetical protein